jgi:hypothetical protein
MRLEKALRAPEEEPESVREPGVSAGPDFGELQFFMKITSRSEVAQPVGTLEGFFDRQTGDRPTGVLVQIDEK